MLIAVLFAAYLLGSIPFGLFLTLMAGLGDIRQFGSGNIGATNVARTGHKKLAVATLLLDAGKGALAVYIAYWQGFHEVMPLVGMLAILGHIFPVWLGFKGGKGVATALGVLFALQMWLGVLVCAAWLLVFFRTRLSSLSSLVSFWCAPIISYLLGNELTAIVCIALAALITFTHRGNIKRLLQGTEARFRKSGV
jgi:acyl phosphate:glycerol-3-phosphate acyltransferase